MSKRKKKGQQERMSVGARLIADVCDVADKPFVEAVENNFAGYFNELAITVRLRRPRLLPSDLTSTDLPLTVTWAASEANILLASESESGSW